MKWRFHTVLTIILVAAFGVFGHAKLATYTDITSAPDFLDTCYVAEMPTELAVLACDEMAASLPQAPFILKVTPIEEPTFFFKGWQQRVQILQVFSGDRLTTNDEIYITLDGGMFYADDNGVDTGYVNFMRSGCNYLIFLSDIAGTTNHMDVFRLQANWILAPVFLYGTCENVIAPVSGLSTYVPYRDVIHNEFFAVDAKGLSVFLALKEKMVDIYS